MLIIYYVHPFSAFWENLRAYLFKFYCFPYNNFAPRVDWSECELRFQVRDDPTPHSFVRLDYLSLLPSFAVLTTMFAIDKRFGLIAHKRAIILRVGGEPPFLKGADIGINYRATDFLTYADIAIDGWGLGDHRRRIHRPQTYRRERWNKFLQNISPHIIIIWTPCCEVVRYETNSGMIVKRMVHGNFVNVMSLCLFHRCVEL